MPPHHALPPTIPPSPLPPPLPNTGDSLVLIADDDSCIGPNMPALEAAAAKLDGQAAVSPAGSYTMRRASPSPRPGSFSHPLDSTGPRDSISTLRVQLPSGASQIVQGAMDIVKHQV